MRKSYLELIKETLNQRAIIDNRQITDDLSKVSDSVLIAFNQACEYMRDLHNWKWNAREISYGEEDLLGEDTFPMPYGIVHGVVLEKDNGEKCSLVYVPELTAEKGCPSQWTQKWDTEDIQIAPAVPADCDQNPIITIQYHDKNIACLGERTDGNLLPQFTKDKDTKLQYLNVPEFIYDAYARCVVLKTRVFLNEGAQGTVFPAQEAEWNEAYNGLMSYAKTPLYTSERTEI